MIVGVAVAVLFAIAFLGQLKGKSWAIPLICILAVADIIGEHIAQGTLMIELMLSYVVAVVLLILVLLQYRNNK